ncbi:MAG: FHA domain-containing protein [Gammaproteobacteria bacterium]|jgi:pSer/pThr/pTyr-binding forkhead associated (FHA) protein
MNNGIDADLAALEGRNFIIGREGHIYVSDPAASKKHAEMTVTGGKIRIRDLGSTNGIYILTDTHPVPLGDEYVEPQQVIVIGAQKFKVQGLLDIVRTFTG